MENFENIDNVAEEAVEAVKVINIDTTKLGVIGGVAVLLIGAGAVIVKKRKSIGDGFKKIFKRDKKKDIVVVEAKVVED